MPVVPALSPTSTAFCSAVVSTPLAACALPAMPATAATATAAASGRIPFVIPTPRSVWPGADRPFRAGGKAREPNVE